MQNSNSSFVAMRVIGRSCLVERSIFMCARTYGLSSIIMGLGASLKETLAHCDPPVPVELNLYEGRPIRHRHSTSERHFCDSKNILWISGATRHNWASKQDLCWCVKVNSSFHQSERKQERKKEKKEKGGKNQKKKTKKCFANLPRLWIATMAFIVLQVLAQNKTENPGDRTDACQLHRATHHNRLWCLTVSIK